jgi:5-hydroxyisourate hydrolase-like protein (transthyretin family)
VGPALARFRQGARALDIEVFDTDNAFENKPVSLFWNSAIAEEPKYPSGNGIIMVNNGITITYVVTDASDENAKDGAIQVTVHGGKSPFSYIWSTGDTTEYISGIPRGLYNLVVTDDFGNLESITINVGVRSAEDEDTCSVKGHILMNGSPAPSTMVILYSKDDDNYKIIGSQTTNQEGIYHFKNLVQNSYLLYAIPSEKDMEFFLPTYYVHHTAWETAHPILIVGNAFEVDIELIPQPISTNEEGYISGFVFYDKGSNVDTIHTTESSNLSRKKPAEDIPVFLQTDNNVVAWSLSDEDGYFEFIDLELDNYEIIAQKPGAEMAHTASVNLTENFSKQEGVVIIIDYPEINSWVSAEQKELHVFPVPASDYIYIDFSNILFTDFTISIYNCKGEIVGIEMYSGTNFSYQYLLYINSLAIGTYYATVDSKEQSAFFKFIKVE